MKRLFEARREVLDAMERLPEVAVPLAEAHGLVLAQPVTAPHDVPPFSNSGVDGFAVVAADTIDPPVTLRVLEDVPAGAVPKKVVEPGCATKVMTGAPMPPGADAMVMVEDTSIDGDTVVVHRAAQPGGHIRPVGGDMAAGETVFVGGERLGPPHLGVLASIGVARPVVVRRPRVALLSTGDEIMPPETEDLRPGTIRDANRPMLAALLGEVGAEVDDLGIIPDDARLLRSALEEAARDSDVVVTSGGVSMGEYDLVKQVLTDLGQVDFWRVAMQPAKPFAFGALGVTPFFGLPGNPVSVMVAFEQFLRPALLARMGARHLFRPRATATMAVDLSTNPDKAVFVRVELEDADPGWSAAPSGGQASNVLSALAAADAFAVIPVGVGDVAAGDQVTIELFRSAESRSLAEAIDD